MLMFPILYRQIHRGTVIRLPKESFMKLCAFCDTPLSTTPHDNVLLRISFTLSIHRSPLSFSINFTIASTNTLSTNLLHL